MSGVFDYPVQVIEEGREAFLRGIDVDPPYGGIYLEAYDYGYSLGQKEKKKEEKIHQIYEVERLTGEYYN